MNDLYTEKVKMLKNIEEDTLSWKDSLGSWIDRIKHENAHPTKNNQQIQHSPHQNSCSILHKNWKKIYMEIQKIQDSPNNPE